jgi:hypothetical protein
MGARLPWPDDDAAVADDKGPFDAGVIHDSGLRQHCAIRRISALGVTVRTRAHAAAGEVITVELMTGQRTPASVEWTEGGDTGLRFARPVDVLALINRKLVSQPVDRRSMPRVELRCGAYVKRAVDFLPVTMRNISARGLQIEGDSLPPVGAYVSLFVEGLNVPAGEIAWRKDNLAGIALLGELSWSSIMPWVRDIVGKAPH